MRDGTYSSIRSASAIAAAEIRGPRVPRSRSMAATPRPPITASADETSIANRAEGQENGDSAGKQSRLVRAESICRPAPQPVLRRARQVVDRLSAVARDFERVARSECACVFQVRQG